jgi:hypothetical protein
MSNCPVCSHPLHGKNGSLNVQGNCKPKQMKPYRLYISAYECSGPPEYSCTVCGSKLKKAKTKSIYALHGAWYVGWAITAYFNKELERFLGINPLIFCLVSLLFLRDFEKNLQQYNKS